MGLEASTRASVLKWLLRVGFAGAALAACVALGYGFQYANWSGFVPAQAPSHWGPRVPTVGLLGGVPVHIPPGAADYPEFDGDPAWGQWTRHVPVRTPTSSIRRFGMLLRHPELTPVHEPGPLYAGLDALEAEVDHPWVLALVVSGERFPGADALRRFVRERVPDDAHWPAPAQPGRQHRVDFMPPAMQAARHEGLGPVPDDRHLAYDDAGHLLAYIACSNDPVLPRHCVQVWSLERHGWPVLVSVHYRRSLEAEWAHIQRGVTNALLTMRVSP